MEERAARRLTGSARQRRARRARLGLLFTVVLAFVLGAALGRQSHATQEELTEAQQAARSRDSDISQEVNRVLLELWKMEDVEALRNSGRLR